MERIRALVDRVLTGKARDEMRAIVQGAPRITLSDVGLSDLELSRPAPTAR